MQSQTLIMRTPPVLESEHGTSILRTLYENACLHTLLCTLCYYAHVYIKNWHVQYFTVLVDTSSMILQTFLSVVN